MRWAILVSFIFYLLWVMGISRSEGIQLYIQTTYLECTGPINSGPSIASVQVCKYASVQAGDAW